MLDRNGKEIEFDGMAELAGLCSAIGGVPMPSMDVFLLLGNVYKQGQQSGYRVGYEAGAASVHKEGGV